MHSFMGEFSVLGFCLVVRANTASLELNKLFPHTTLPVVQICIYVLNFVNKMYY